MPGSPLLPGLADFYFVELAGFRFRYNFSHGLLGDLSLASHVLPIRFGGSLDDLLNQYRDRHTSAGIDS